MNVRPVHWDGLLWIIIGTCSAVLPVLSSDEAYKYANPTLLFYVKVVLIAANGGAASLKMFRSTSYANSLNPTQPPKPS